MHCIPGECSPEMGHAEACERWTDHYQRYDPRAKKRLKLREVQERMEAEARGEYIPPPPPPERVHSTYRQVPDPTHATARAASTNGHAQHVPTEAASLLPPVKAKNHTLIKLASRMLLDHAERQKQLSPSFQWIPTEAEAVQIVKACRALLDECENDAAADLAGPAPVVVAELVT